MAETAHGAQTALVTNVLATGVSTWLQYKQNKEAQKAAKRQYKIMANVAAKSLALKYNSILAQTAINRKQAARNIEAIKLQSRAAEGEAIASAAATGAMGKRVTLSRNMAILGGAEREITAVESDLKTAQNQLLMQAESDEQAIAAELRTSTPDIPIDTTVATFATGVQDILSSYGTYKERKLALENKAAGIE